MRFKFEGGRPSYIGDETVFHAIRHLASKEGKRSADNRPYFLEASRIEYNMPIAPSIDQYLDTHRENKIAVELGKVGIVKSIIDAERESLLFVDNSNIYNKLDTFRIKNTWLKEFFGILVSQRDFDAFLSALSNITFVSFNYDRCIAQFFLQVSKEYFGLSQGQLGEVERTLRVIHPYGSLGALRWRLPADSGFGEELSADQLIEVAAKVKTFTEGSESKEIEEIRNAFFEADLIMFLGFSFLPLNMDMLLGGERFECSRVLATSKGLSGESAELVSQELAIKLAGGDRSRIAMKNCRCFELFFEFQRFMIGA